MNTACQRLAEIEEDAARAAAATLRFARLTAAREEVSQFLDSILARARAITLDTAKHPSLHLEMEKIKALLTEITIPEILHAACELTINFLSARLHAAESAFGEASKSNKLFRGRKRIAASNGISAAIEKLRENIETLRFEKASAAFQICATCFSFWPRQYKRCGHCGEVLGKPLKLE